MACPFGEHVLGLYTSIFIEFGRYSDMLWPRPYCLTKSGDKKRDGVAADNRGPVRWRGQHCQRIFCRQKGLSTELRCKTFFLATCPSGFDGLHFVANCLRQDQLNVLYEFLHLWWTANANFKRLVKQHNKIQFQDKGLQHYIILLKTGHSVPNANNDFCLKVIVLFKHVERIILAHFIATIQHLGYVSNVLICRLIICSPAQQSSPMLEEGKHYCNKMFFFKWPNQRIKMSRDTVANVLHL